MSRKAGQHKLKGRTWGEGRQKPAADLKILCGNNDFSQDELQRLLKTKPLTEEIGLLWFWREATQIKLAWPDLSLQAKEAQNLSGSGGSLERLPELPAALPVPRVPHRHCHGGPAAKFPFRVPLGPLICPVLVPAQTKSCSWACRRRPLMFF